jgi:hypothetical protein
VDENGTLVDAEVAIDIFGDALLRPGMEPVMKNISLPYNGEQKLTNNGPNVANTEVNFETTIDEVTLDVGYVDDENVWHSLKDDARALHDSTIGADSTVQTVLAHFTTAVQTQNSFTWAKNGTRNIDVSWTWPVTSDTWTNEDDTWMAALATDLMYDGDIPDGRNENGGYDITNAFTGINKPLTLRATVKYHAEQVD